MRLKLISILFLVVSSAAADFYPDRARIITEDGHLQFFVAENRNISLKTGKNGAVLLNGQDITSTLQIAKDTASQLTQLRQTEMAAIQRQQTEFQDVVGHENSPETILGRLSIVESGLSNLTSRISSSDASPTGNGRNNNRLQRRVRQLERNLNEMQQLLARNDCASSPCKNGGTCLDSYGSFRCLCPSNWEGTTCETDLNECAAFAGTDLGCQNGATCINTAGSFQCLCASGWFGVHCTRRNDGCSSGTNEEMCGHGICINQPGQGRGFICLCEQGWTNSPSNPSCTIDIDECNSPFPVCSVSPAVRCINLPGSFTCGSCPPGYTGNGHYCIDIDECQTNNGGCSLNPRVQCTNTIGSRSCGPCPAGYQGDGVTCSYVGVCAVNNGGCSPYAFCYENPIISASFVSCQCRPGYTGSGFGPSGCLSVGSGSPGSGSSGSGSVIPISPCSPNPCQYGTCSERDGNFVCVCQPGYGGPLCNIRMDPCSSSPCLNGATCAVVGPNQQYRCLCPAGFTGSRCENQLEECGAFLESTNGTLSFPASDGSLYPHQVSCAWVIRTLPGKVLNLTFTRFHLEASPGCSYDFLQLNDGEDAAARTIGRYCGDQAPGNGNFITTHNVIYMWFRSDHSLAGQGFQVSWNTTEPVCGGNLISTTHGTINSPGYPGRYPHNRDCLWIVNAPLGKRIQFVFATLQIEHHSNCSFDFLEIRDGNSPNDPVLGKFCDTSNPAPLTTSGPTALVYFHSDASESDNGFHITYAIVPGIPGCGGLLTSPSGGLSSPNHPDTYEHNLDCEWVIRATPEERILLSFTSFSTESSRDCRYDYVEVRQGGSADSPLIGRFCGHNIPGPITSLGNQLFIRFRSDYSVSHSGFRAQYETVCGGTYSELSGTINSPNYPTPYGSNKECVYVIALPPGKAIRMDFLFFDVEGSEDCTFDYLEVRDGDNGNSSLIGRYCGPPDQSPPSVIASHNYLWLKFRTDSSVQNLGFMANYSSIDVACGGILTDPQGFVSSPRHPESYPHGTTCRWIIRAQPDKIVRIQWLSFALENTLNCRYDAVEVYDNTTVSNTGGLVGRYCGTTLPPMITSMGSTVTVIFRSDSSVAAEGFSLSYTTVDASTICGGTYYTQTGMIVSPGYPFGYPPGRDCTWVIEAPRRQQIMLNVEDFDIERHTDCHFDFLEIRNGAAPTSPLIGRFCGNITGPSTRTVATIPRSIPSHSHQIYLRFVSDSSLSGRGFKINWDATTTGCGGVLSSPTGSLTSPGYPSPYGSNTECFWRIQVSQGSRVQFVFVDLDLERQTQTCTYDYVELRNGKDRRAPLIGRYCSSGVSIAPIAASSNFMFVKFRSDFSVAGNGFHARYETLCNTELRGLSGVIESPNFPNAYPHDRNCTWTIVAPRGNRINITFSHFDVEDHFNNTCVFDFVEISESERTLGHFCGTNTLPPMISSTQDQVNVRFMSDHSVAHNGFRLEWRVVGCGGRLTKPRGFFTSMNYPNPYPMATDCVWEIQTEPGTRIELTVNDFDIESSQGCVFDYLKVYGGPDESSPLLTTLCHRQEGPAIVTATGNNMYVHFRSDESVRGKGFRASYNSLPQGCGGRFTAPSGRLSSPNYPQNYDHDSDCGWLIEVAPNHVVELNFMDFDVEPYTNCTYDYVDVYDGPEVNNATLLLRHCGTAVPNPPTLRSTSNQMYIRLKADGSQAARGFLANYTTGCGASITVEDSGELTSPSFPHLYNGGLNCSWVLTATNPADHVTLTFTHLDIHSNRFPGSMPSTNCSTDYVQVKDGDDSDAPLVGTYCLSRIPPAITSQGSSFYVHMMSTQGLGVGFRAVYSVLSEACGGNLTSEHGVFASPSYPSSYPLSIECVWTITASPGNRIALSFNQFNVQESDYCNDDYVEIRQDYSGGQLLGHFCGSQIPANLTASNRLWIKFRSDDSGTAPGFLADYSLVHGNELSGSRGEIASPLYPVAYSRFGEFTWRVIVDEDRRVRLTFLEGRLEKNPMDDSCISYVEIRDGYDDQAPLLGTYCGWFTRRPATVITATQNVVFIRFVSRYTNEGSVFKLRWEGVRETTPTFPGIRPSTNSSSVPGCGGELFIGEGNSTVISSPGFPNGYAPNLNCIWTLTTDAHSRIALSFNTIDMEAGNCQFDRLEINNVGFGTLGRFCRSDQQGQTVTSTANQMAVSFVTDSSVNRTGFRVTARSVCGGLLRGSNGIIRTPGYPNSYPESTACEWEVRVRPGRTIEVRFDNINIASAAPACAEDYVILRNGDSVDSPMLGEGRFCGNSVPVVPETSSNRLLVKFVSDSRNSGTGFQLRYREKSTACGGQFVLSEDQSETTIESPNYPSAAQRFTECEWVVLAPPGHSIQMDFTDSFDMTGGYGCRLEGVEARNGGTVSSALIDRYCGNQHPGTVYSTGNAIYLRYYTTVQDPHTGFRARLSIARCGGTIVASRGVVSSPNYPSSYEPNTNCLWTIRGPIGHYLNLQFTNFDLPQPLGNNCSVLDYVEIRETNATNEVLGTFCGSTLPSLVRTYSNEVKITFHSGSRSFNRQGFMLTFNSSLEGCGGELTNPSGIIQSPGYPTGYPHRRLCLWKIQGPEGRRVRLEFTDFALEEPRVYGNQSVCYDSVTVMNGPVINGSPLFAVTPSRCGTTVPEAVESTGPDMTILFRTDGSLTHRGFSATYNTDLPAACGGDLPPQPGYFTSPGLLDNNQGNYSYSLYCQWKLSNPNSMNSTVIYSVDFLSLEAPSSSGRCFDSLEFFGGSANFPLGQYCGNLSSPVQVASPYPESLVRFRTDYTVAGVGFNVSYKLSPCGGVITASQTLTTPSFPSTYSANLDCVWLVDFSETGQQVEVTFDDFQLDSDDCSQDSLTILNGRSSSSPQIGKFCGSTKPSTIRSQSPFLWIAFHSDSAVNNARGFKLSVTGIASGCGGILHRPYGTFNSPNYPSPYQNDQECEWEIRLDPGYVAKLSFVNRFDIETSPNCQNDYVEIFDQSNDTWVSRGKYCGKQGPPEIQSSSSTMKIRFRTNSATTADGFKARWTVGCGGNFTSSTGMITSPGYPNRYLNNLTCNYYIDAAPSDYVVATFSEPFNIQNHPVCAYDRLSAYQGNSTQGRVLGRFCGRQVPPAIVSRGPLFLQFLTDLSVTRNGFMLTYETHVCGGTVTSPSVIRSPLHPDNYIHNLNCTWLIQAPPDRVVDIKFESLELESQTNCRFDYVAVYEGSTITNQSALLRRVCGNFTFNLPRIKSRGSQALLQFRTDWSVSHGGFSAAIRFTPGEQQGCGGVVNLTESQPREIRAPNAAFTPTNGRIEGDLDCPWMILTNPGQVVRLQFTQLDLENPVADKCQGDFVEIRDGPGAGSSLIGRYCGSVPPPALIGSTNVMWLRFTSGTSGRRANFVATASSQEPVCGSDTLLTPGETPQVLTTPSYPNPPPANIRCRWMIDGSLNNSQVQIHFLEMALGSTQSLCTEDRVEIDDIINAASTQVTDLVLNGDSARMVQIGNDRVLLQRELGQKLTFCGRTLPHDVISSGTSLAVTLITGSQPSGSGLRLQYSLPSCNRTYDSPQGRIVSPGWPGTFRPNQVCQFSIQTAPNTTVSLYFSLMRLQNSINCTTSSLEIRDGDSENSPLLMNLCGSAIPSAIHSSSNRLWFKFRASRFPLRGYDFTYTSTSQGPGCGGSVFNTRGSLTSPRYPGNATQSTDCRWEISVPLGSRIKIDFLDFAFGPAAECSSNFVELYDVQSSSQDEVWRARYCGNDRPSSYVGSTNAVTVRYVTSANNTGPGWRLAFESVQLHSLNP